MRAIDFGKSFKALSAFVDNYNKTKELSQRLRQNTIATAQDLIKLYAMALRRSENKNKLLGISSTEYPPLFTNNIQLSQRLKISGRTIQRHISKLIETGFITKKIFHGTNSQYELHFNQEILSPCKTGYSVIFPEEEVGATEPIASTCPDTVSCTTGTRIIINTNVNKCEKPFSTGDKGYTGYNFDLWSGSTDPFSCPPQEGLQEHVLAGGAQRYINLLWDYASKTIYKSRSFTTLDVQQVKRYLQPYFHNVKEESLDKVYCTYIERINLVEKYVDKDPLNRFVPSPHHYFNIQNHKGFRGTKSWLEKHVARKEELAKETIFKKILHIYQKQCTSAHITQNVLQTFRECEAAVQNLRSTKLLKSFYHKAGTMSPVLFTKSS